MEKTEQQALTIEKPKQAPKRLVITELEPRLAPNYPGGTAGWGC